MTFYRGDGAEFYPCKTTDMQYFLNYQRQKPLSSLFYRPSLLLFIIIIVWCSKLFCCFYSSRKVITGGQPVYGNSLPEEKKYFTTLKYNKYKYFLNVFFSSF